MTAPTDFTRLRAWCERHLWTTPRGTPVRGDDPDDPMPFHDVPLALATLDETVAVLRELTTAAHDGHDAMQTWFSSEYLANPKSVALGDAIGRAIAVLSAHDGACLPPAGHIVHPDARCDCCGALRDPYGPGAILPRCASCGALRMPFELFHRECVDCIPEGARQAALASVEASWKAEGAIFEARAEEVERRVLSVPCAGCGHDLRSHSRHGAPSSTYCSWTPPEAEPQPGPDDFCKCRAFVAPSPDSKGTTP